MLTIALFLLLTFGPLLKSNLVSQQQAFLYVSDPQGTRATIGSTTTLACRVGWRDALGRAWNGPTPPVQVQWIINGFGYRSDLLSSSFQGRVELHSNSSRGIFDLIIHSVHAEDEGLYACQAQILYHNLPNSENATALLPAGVTGMMFVRSKEVKLVVIYPPLRFGLFGGELLTPDLPPMPISQGFVQFAKPTFFTCASEASRPAAVLELAVNATPLAVAGVESTRCASESGEGQWCAKSLLTFQFPAFDVTVAKYTSSVCPGNAHRLGSVRLIVGFSLKQAISTAIILRCHIKNAHEFHETQFRTSAQAIIRLHDIRNVSIIPISSVDGFGDASTANFRCMGFISRLPHQRITLRWNIERTRMDKVPKLYLQDGGTLSRFYSDLELQQTRAGIASVLRCTVMSEATVFPYQDANSNFQVVSSNFCGSASRVVLGLRTIRREARHPRPNS
uniref:Ig-like domain-containing protein n=2 Tax=Mesocestoides corti TaxID=53468 RepID=A0A5K3FCA6_MESCO